MTQDTKSASQLKEAGNQAYKNGDFDSALALYTEGLTLAADEKEKAVLYKNRAAVHLKNESYEEVISDCDAELRF